MEKIDFEFIHYEIDHKLEHDLLMNRKNYDKRFQERYDTLQSNIYLIEKLKSIAINLSRNDTATIINSYGYLNLLAYDLISVGYNLYFEKKRWQKIYFARQVSLLIYEALNDIPTITGKIFKVQFNSARGIPAVEDFLSQLKQCNKRLQEYRNNNLDKLKNIRMNVAAHRDDDIDEQLSIIKNINPYDTIKQMTDFDKTLRHFIDLLQSLIVHLVKPL